MAETKPITTRNVEPTVNAGDRVIRTYEEALSEPPPPPAPTQEEADAIKEGTYGEGGEEPPPPEGETQEQRQQREEQKRQRREAKAQSDQQAGYQTR